MPTFFSDPADSLYITLFIVMLVGVGIWYRYRTRKTLIAAGIGVGLLVALFLIDRLFESPREIVIRTAGEFEADFNTGEWNKFEKHIAENFDRKGKKKKDVKVSYDFAKAYNAKVRLWSFNRDDVVVTSDTITVGFDAKPVCDALGQRAQDDRQLGRPCRRRIEKRFQRRARHARQRLLERARRGEA